MHAHNHHCEYSPPVHDRATAISRHWGVPAARRKATTLPMNSNPSPAHLSVSNSDIDRFDHSQVDAATIASAQSHTKGERALVLSGGGSTGNAWMIGVTGGLLEAGVDVTAADLVIGTSAGATTAAQILGANPADLLAATLAAVPPRPAAPVDPARRSGAERAAAESMERTSTIIAVAADAADMRRRMGAAARVLAGDGAWQERWRASVAARLPSQDWPERLLQITVVDAETGDPAIFDRHSGVELADAIAASCSSGPAYRVGDRSYIDGGYRRNENADLAAGYRRVVILSPFGGRTRHPLAWGMQLAAQVDELRASGSRVAVIVPGSDADYMLGASAMDLSARLPAAQAGYDQGKHLAGQIAAFWH